MISEASYTTSCYDAQVAPGPIHPPVHDDVRSDLSSSCYDVQVSPGHFNSLRQQWWPFHGGPIWWPAADAVYPISSWSASATNWQSSQNQRPSLASIHVANCSCPMSAGHTNAHPRRRLGGWQRFSRKINKKINYMMALLFELFVYCNEISLWLGAGSCVRDTLIWLRWNCWIGSKNRCKFFFLN